MKCEVELPDGKYCTGCSCGITMPAPRNKDNWHIWKYGCALVHGKCKADGDYDNRAIKHKDCPTLKR